MTFQLPQTEPLRGSVRRGQQARKKGLPESSCPYQSDGPAGAHHRAWLVGWEHPNALVPKTTAGTRTGRPNREKTPPPAAPPPARDVERMVRSAKGGRIAADELLGQQLADLLVEERARLVQRHLNGKLHCTACTRGVGRPPLRLAILDHEADCQVLRWERALLAHRDHVIARLDADEEAAA